MGFYHLLTFGCQMNKNDSERIATLLENLGLQKTAEVKQADVIVVNTCSVRQTAEDRVFGMVMNWQALRADKPHLVVAITGCMPGRDQDNKMREKIRGVDLFFPTTELPLLPARLKQLIPDIVNCDFANPADYLQLPPKRDKIFQAFVTIQTGCNHFCTYCVVPFSRGLEGNRPARDILDEVRDLAEHGCLEVTLLGQIVNHYQAPDPHSFSPHNPYRRNDFAKLLWEINQLPGLQRVHWTAAHPLYMDDEVIDALSLPMQINYLHLPVQSGNDEILRRMNRRHDRAWYLDRIAKIRAQRPTIALGTDFIVGFCGETEAQFNDTVSLFAACHFDIAYQAMYSVRSGTAAAKVWKDDVSREEKRRRWQVIQDLVEQTAFTNNQAYRDKTVSVLVDRWEKGMALGNSHEMKLVQFAGSPEMIGKIVNVKITEPEMWVLRGELVNKE